MSSNDDQNNQEGNHKNRIVVKEKGVLGELNKPHVMCNHLQNQDVLLAVNESC